MQSERANSVIPAKAGIQKEVSIRFLLPQE
jgi:hypothetical protein